MTSEELFRALACVDPMYLEQSESGGNGHKRRISRLALIAAAVAMMTCAAFAATLIQNCLTLINSKVFHTSGVVENFRGEITLHEGWLSLDLGGNANPDRPQWIENCYLPMYFVDNWESESMEISQAQNSQEWKNQRPDIQFTWTNDEGQYAIYMQTPIPVYTGDVWPYDEISIGYNATVDTEQCLVGDYNVLRVVAPPSSLETDGKVDVHPGYRRYFWSDGDYVFSLEVSYDTQDTVVEQALMTMTQVEEPDDYRVLIEVNSTNQENEEEENLPEVCKPVLFPGWLPDGWEQELGRIQENKYCQFEWRYYPEESSVWSCLTLEQAEPGAFVRMVEEYETSTADRKKEETSLLGWNADVYYRENIYEAFWTTGEEDYYLAFRGREGLSPEEFLQILQKLYVVEDYSLFLTQ